MVTPHTTAPPPTSTPPGPTARPRPGTPPLAGAPSPSGTAARRSGAHTPGPLSAELVEVTSRWADHQHRLIELAAAFDDSAEWLLAGSPSAAHWLAAVADVEVCTAREWVRIGHQLRALPAIADAFAARQLSYSKVRTLTRIANADNEAELLAIALQHPAGHLGRALATWLTRNNDDHDLDAHHHRSRSVRWRLEPDGMTVFTLRLPPLLAAALIAWLTTWTMTTRRRPAAQRGTGASADASPPPTVAQQHADALAALVTGATATSTATATTPCPAGPSPSDGPPGFRPGASADASSTPSTSPSTSRRPRSTDPAPSPDADGTTRAQPDGPSRHQLLRPPPSQPQEAPARPEPNSQTSQLRHVDTEIVIHVRSDGCSFDDGTPVTDSIVERLAPTAFLRALIHDAERRPINASSRQRHPSTRQKRVVKERDRVCCDCGRPDLLEYDHVPDFDTSGRTVVDELQLRCAPCHDQRHAA